MPVPEADHVLPQSKSMLDAFFVPTQAHFTIGQTIEEIREADFEKVAKVGADFFTAGVAYLANRGHDEYIQEVGTVAWWAVNQKRALTLFTDNMRVAAIRLGIPPPVAHTEFSRNDEPKVICGVGRQGVNILEIAYVLMPFEFVAKAQTNPIDALATMAWICSHVRDIANGRITVDPQYMTPRAGATEAHFLREAVRRHPKVPLSEDSQTKLSLYPEAIYSARLPKEALYKGISGTEFKSASRN